MTNQDKQETGGRATEMPLPQRTLVLTTSVKESDRHSCGERRVKGAFPGKKVPRDVAVTLTQRCYVLPAGGRTKLKIAFLEGKEKVRPKGTLVLAPKRGKVSPLRVELDGSKDHVEVEYTAPDETIRVSVRAFFPGFARGKIHLHLE